jgi:hypothetical protein
MLQLKMPRKTLLLVLLLGLLAPSAWMIATIPPLWRDADAYVQLTQDPRVSKFWGHAPLYCYVVKVPLFLGEEWERLRGLPTLPRTIASQPAVTDSGIAILIVAQHLAMSLAVLLFICAVTQIFWMRLLLVLIWASNALFYTYAHCVGSETLGIILVLWFCARVVRLVQTREPSWSDWYFAGALLLLCMLTRDLNIGLVALLPLAFLIGRLLEGRALSLHKLFIAVGLGIACIAIAPSVPETLARKTKLHPHSRFGYIFLWRLHSLSALPPAARTALMQKVSERAPTDEVRRLVQLYEQMMSEHTDPIDPTGFINRAVTIFGGPPHWEEVDAGLRQMAFAFLWPPTRELLEVAKRDFVAVMKSPGTVISDYLFYTTAYYFEHKEEMTACANLSTFRGDATAEKIRALPLDHRYFRLWEPLTYRSFVSLWFIALVVFLAATRRHRQEASATTGLAIALVVVGLFQFAVTCVIHDYEPRFSVSMWQLLLLSVFLLLGMTSDLVLAPDKEQSPPGS